MKMKSNKLYYGWIIVAVVFICLAVSYSLRYSYSVLPVELEKKFSWTRAEIYTSLSITMLIYGGMGPLVGAILDRFGPRALYSSGALILCAGFFGMSQISALWQLYFFSTMAGIGMAAVGIVPSSVLISRWFIRRRGTAIGIAACGTGLGMLVITGLIVPWIIDNHGFRAAYLFMALLAGLIVLPLGALLMRRSPESIGLLPDAASNGGIAPSPPNIIVNKTWTDTEWTVAKAVRTRQFWLLFITVTMMPFCIYAVMFHQVQYAVDMGFSVQVASGAFGVLGLFGLIGKFGWGFVSDQIGRELTFTMGILCLVAGICVLVETNDPSRLWLLYLYSGIFGLGYGVMQPVLSATVADLFQGKNLGGIFGFISIGVAFGGSLGPYFSGYIFDISQSYTQAFLIALTGLLISISFIWMAAPRKVRLVAGRAR